MQFAEVVSIITSIVLLSNAISVWRKYKPETEGIIAQASHDAVQSLQKTLGQVSAERDEFERRYEQAWACAWRLVKQLQMLQVEPVCKPEGHEPDTGPLRK